MPKINVYLPDELAAAVKEANIPVSAICQAALQRAVRDIASLRDAAHTPATDERAWAGAALDRYTNRARQALVLARQAAVDLGHDVVDTEHLLLGVLGEGGNLAVRVLETLDVVPADVEAELRAHLRSGIAGGATPPTIAASLNLALTLATAESAAMGHNYIGCEHLLLGMVAEPDGLGGTVLRRLGVELRVTRRTVQTALAGFVHAAENLRSRTSQAAPDAPPAHVDLLEEILRRLDEIEARLPG